MSRVPKWVTGDTGRSSGSAPPRGRPLTAFVAEREQVARGDDRSGSSKRASISQEGDTGRAKLGRTSGLMAVGAWSARMEIAAMLENGISAAEVLRVIKKGEESETPLKNAESPATPAFGGFSRPSGSSAPLPRRPYATSPQFRENRNSHSTASRGTDRSTKDLPRWIAAAPFANLTFVKKADMAPRKPPQDVEEYSEDDIVPTTPEESNIPEPRERAAELANALDAMTMDGLFGDFGKKATPPTPAAEAEAEKRSGFIPAALPCRSNPLEQEKLLTFRVLCRKIFDDLVIMRVSMDILESVVPVRDVDEAKFFALTDPRSAAASGMHVSWISTFLGFRKAIPEALNRTRSSLWVKWRNISWSLSRRRLAYPLLRPLRFQLSWRKTSQEQEAGPGLLEEESGVYSTSSPPGLSSELPREGSAGRQQAYDRESHFGEVESMYPSLHPSQRPGRDRDVQAGVVSGGWRQSSPWLTSKSKPYQEWTQALGSSLAGSERRQ